MEKHLLENIVERIDNMTKEEIKQELEEVINFYPSFSEYSLLADAILEDNQPHRAVWNYLEKTILYLQKEKTMKREDFLKLVSQVVKAIKTSDKLIKDEEIDSQS